MRIRLGKLRQIVRETAEQLVLPGVDIEPMGSGDEARDLEIMRRQLSDLKAKNKAEMPTRTRQNKEEFDSRRREEMMLRKKITALHRKLNPTKYDLLSPAEKQRWAVYGGDPSKNPRGLGT